MPVISVRESFEPGTIILYNHNIRGSVPTNKTILLSICRNRTSLTYYAKDVGAFGLYEISLGRLMQTHSQLKTKIYKLLDVTGNIISNVRDL